MGFLEKVKNMFTEEIEEDEVKVEKVDKVKKEIIASFSDSPIKEEEELIEPAKEEVEDTKPVFFNDDDFEDLDVSSKKFLNEKKEKNDFFEEKRNTKLREDKHTRHGNYKEMMKESFEEPSDKEVEEKKIFKPTPIISPIYGVLDKNYHKEDIVSKNDVKRETPKEPLIDQIRNKAYGTLEDELEDTLFGKDSILKSNEAIDEDVKETKDIDELTDDISKDLDDLLLKKESKKKNLEKDNEDFLDFIDSTLYKDEGEE